MFKVRTKARDADDFNKQLGEQRFKAVWRYWKLRTWELQTERALMPTMSQRQPQKQQHPPAANFLQQRESVMRSYSILRRPLVHATATNPRPVPQLVAFTAPEPALAPAEPPIRRRHRPARPRMKSTRPRRQHAHTCARLCHTRRWAAGAAHAHWPAASLVLGAVVVVVVPPLSRGLSRRASFLLPSLMRRRRQQQPCRLLMDASSHAFFFFFFQFFLSQCFFFFFFVLQNISYHRFGDCSACFFFFFVLINLHLVLFSFLYILL